MAGPVRVSKFSALVSTLRAKNPADSATRRQSLRLATINITPQMRIKFLNNI